MHFERQKAFKMHKIHIFSRKTVFFLNFLQAIITGISLNWLLFLAGKEIK